MKWDDQFGLPVITFVDTAGAFPGVEAEERGQAEAIARSTEACLSLGVPMIAAVVGEGGSGGAIALAAANRVLMFENAIYSVISPEGCASILWRSADKAADAAEAMRITAADLKRRSEEHTSELQSLMRNSYALFCLNKKNAPAFLILRQYLTHVSITVVHDGRDSILR